MKIRESKDMIMLGSGTYGNVYLAKHHQSGIPLAVKLFHKNHNDTKNILKEATISIWLNSTKASPYCFGIISVQTERVTDKGLDKEKNPYHALGIVYEFVGDVKTKSSITLSDLIKMDEASNGHQAALTKREWVEVCAMTAVALDAIHRQYVTVNDLKRNNVLMRKEHGKWKPYLCDFGLAIYIMDNPRIVKGFSEAVRDPVEFMKKCPHYAPELIKTSHCGPYSDVYSFGCILRVIARIYSSVKDFNLA